MYSDTGIITYIHVTYTYTHVQTYMHMYINNVHTSVFNATKT